MKKNISIIDSALNFFRKGKKEAQAFKEREENIQMLEEEYEKKL